MWKTILYFVSNQFIMKHEKQIERERLIGKLEAAIIALESNTPIELVVERLKTITDEHIPQSI